MLNIIDVIIGLFILFGGILGFKRGIIKQGVITVGTFLVLFLSFLLKNKISFLMYNTIPFFDFDLLIKNASILNIVVFETLAFLITFSLLEVILIVIIKLSSVIETLLKIIPFLKGPSQFLGAILGLVESYLIIFIILFVISNPTLPINGSEILNSSKLTKIITTNTFLISDFSSKNFKTFDEITELVENKDKYNATEFDCKAMKIMIKNKFITKKAATYLYNNDKINTSCGL